MCPGGRPGLQNQWQVAQSRLRWVRLPRLPVMEITLFQEDETLRFERIVLYPYPDLKRVWTRIWVTAVQDQHPNIELRIFNPDGTENNSVLLLSQSDQRIETTFHLRDGVAGAIYQVLAELTLGISENPEHLDHQEFEMCLEFRNPERNEPGFGMGVDWQALQQEE